MYGIIIKALTVTANLWVAISTLMFMLYIVNVKLSLKNTLDSWLIVIDCLKLSNRAGDVLKCVGGIVICVSFALLCYIAASIPLATLIIEIKSWQ